MPAPEVYSGRRTGAFDYQVDMTSAYALDLRKQFWCRSEAQNGGGCAEFLVCCRSYRMEGVLLAG